MHPFLDATVAEDTKRLRKLLKEGQVVGYSNPMGETALHLAASIGSTKVAALLLEHGANVNACDQSGNPPLWPAVFESRVEMVELLRRRGADPLLGGCAQFARSERPLVAALFDDLPRKLPTPQKVERSVMTEGEIPVPTDGKVKISAESNRLWKLLVPPSGHAPTVQGEVIRGCGRLSDEAFRNGNCNWGPTFESVCDFLKQTLSDEETFSKEQIKELRLVIKAVRRAGNELPDVRDPKSPTNPYNRLRYFGVGWCLTNPELIPFVPGPPKRKHAKSTAT